MMDELLAAWPEDVVLDCGHPIRVWSFLYEGGYRSWMYMDGSAVDLRSGREMCERCAEAVRWIEGACQ